MSVARPRPRALRRLTVGVAAAAAVALPLTSLSANATEHRLNNTNPSSIVSAVPAANTPNITGMSSRVNTFTQVSADTLGGGRSIVEAAVIGRTGREARRPGRP